jgi:type II secretory pathway pseudopilin PulG
MLDDDGVDFLGMRLAVVLIAAALLLSLAAVYVNDCTDRASRERARQEAGRIASLAQAEYASGCPGTGSTASMAVTIPRSVRRVAFGTDDARTYFIEFQDGSREVHAAECRFSPATLYPGYHRLELEAAAGDGGYAVSLREA